MNFYHQLDAIMKQDMGGRGLLASLPENPIKEAAESLRHAARVILLTGFPVRMEDGGCIGETDGPSGTANLAFAFTQAGAQVLVVTDRASYHLPKEALSYRAPKAALSMIPEDASGDFIRDCIRSFRPTHFISLERPGKALDGHYHNMRGETIDDMITDSALFLSEARAFGAETISIGDGGNEMGMGTYRHEIEAHVPCGKLICASEAADITLASGVSNWWGWGSRPFFPCRPACISFPPNPRRLSCSTGWWRPEAWTDVQRNTRRLWTIYPWPSISRCSARLPGPYGPDGRKRPGVCIFQLRKLPSGAGVTRRTARLPGKPPSRRPLPDTHKKTGRPAAGSLLRRAVRPFSVFFIFLFRSGVDIIHKASGGNDLLHEREGTPVPRRTHPSSCCG